MATLNSKSHRVIPALFIEVNVKNIRECECGGIGSLIKIKTLSRVFYLLRCDSKFVNTNQIIQFVKEKYKIQITSQNVKFQW